MPEGQQREFTGIWIPREIVEDDRLSWTERAVFAEIAAYKECFMSNDFLAARVGVSGRWIQQTISKLKKLGYVKQTRYDGRKRFLQAYTQAAPDTVDTNLGSRQTRTTVRPSNESDFVPLMHSTSPIDNNREQRLEHNEVSYRERSQSKQVKPYPSIKSLEDIQVSHEWQDKAKYIASKLGTPPKQISSVLKACRDFTPYEVDTALSHAVDATVRDRTALFFKSLYQMRHLA